VIEVGYAALGWKKRKEQTVSVGDEVGFELLSHYLYSLASTIDGRENRVIPYRDNESLLFLLHRAEITEPLYARESGVEPPPYDKPYYTLCFEFVTDDVALWESVVGTLIREVPFLGRDTADDE